VALVDIVAALALVALVSATTIPVVAGALEQERALLGAQFVATRIAQTQLEALRRGVFVALRVELGAADAALQMFADGNDNGVSMREIGMGVDPPVAPRESVGVRARDVSIRINQRVLDAGGTAWLDAGSDPLRLGSSSLLSCSPTGSLTSGTIYVAASRGPQMAVRATGSSGRVRVLRFDPAGPQWRP
jgi:hypothetical protein